MDTTQKKREETGKEPRKNSRKIAGGAKPAQKQRAPGAAAGKKAAPARKAASKPAEKSAVRKKTAPKAPVKKPESSGQQGLPDSVSNKKRAYGNSKPKKKSTLNAMNEVFRNTARRTAEKTRTKVRKKHSQRPQQPTPAVIYTQPQAFNRNRFLMQLLTVTAVVVALVLGLSVFFKVETITVSGAEVYSAWTIREASGISEGDNLLTFSHARAGALIKANLPYVKSVRFGIKLPDTVNIIIEEEDVVYAVKSSEGSWWLMTSEGRIVEQANRSVAADYTQVLGVTLENPIPNEWAVATEAATVMETGADGETVPVVVTVTGAQRLTAALNILKALEANDIVGAAASVDVTRLEDIILWYGSRYQVNLGDSARLDYKVACMNDAILQMSEYQSGILDVSFTIWPNQVGYTPFG